jgi:phosphoribosylformimino-5-aminoimidazole carboxamide ribotide isomerase
MQILPAIDVMDGGCVRLTEGDFNARKNYDIPAIEVAKNYKTQGSKWVHIVDLDGARDPLKRQLAFIERLSTEAQMNVQTGGGIRGSDDVKKLLGHGVARVIIGSLSIEDVTATKKIIETFGAEKIVLAFDLRGQFVTTSGWQKTSDHTIQSMLDIYKGYAQNVLCTDIAKDGKLAGPNTALYQQLITYAPDMAFQASGGVSHLSDITALKTTGVSACVIGKALYENRFTLTEALAC